MVSGKQLGLDHGGAKRAVSFYRQVLAILTEVEGVPPAYVQGRPTR
jgi:hypothetical protein